MTTDEESLDGGSSVKIELVLARVVARFHAWKFGAKAEKRGALKVSNAGKVKKQKTPIKTSVHGALEARGQEEMDAMLNQTKNVKSPYQNLNLNTPIGSNECVKLELSGPQATPDS
jgi:hypothetical protein